jgi:uncharacterized membrane protein YcaP (DUF421 family)
MPHQRNHRVLLVVPILHSEPQRLVVTKMEGLGQGDVWGILRVLAAGTIGYAFLVVVLRSTGNRTLSKFNAFDFVVTVALGSALATTMLSKSTTWLEGVAGMGLLVMLQYAVSWLSVRSPLFETLIKSEPKLLVHNGELLRQALRSARISEEEIRSAMRMNGINALNQDTSVVLETNGSLSVFGCKADKG